MAEPLSAVAPSGRDVGQGGLVGAMAKRLAAAERGLREARVRGEAAEAKNGQLERTCASLRGKLKAVEAQKDDWERRARAAEDAANASGGAAATPEEDADDTGGAEDAAAAAGGAGDVMHLKNECARLRKINRRAWAQVFELKQFLREYGMVWVGDEGAEDQTDAAKENRGANTAKTQPAQAALPRAIELTGVSTHTLQNLDECRTDNRAVRVPPVPAAHRGSVHRGRRLPVWAAHRVLAPAGRVADRAAVFP